MKRLLLAKVDLRLPVAEMERLATAAERVGLPWHEALRRMEIVALNGARERVLAEMADWEAGDPSYNH